MRGILVALVALTLPLTLAAQGEEPVAASAPVEPAAPPVEGAAIAEAPAPAQEAPAVGSLENATAAPVSEEPHVAGEEPHQAAGLESAAGAEHAAGGEHAEGGEHHPGVTVAQVANFLIFFGLLGFLLRKPLASFLRERRQSIADSLAAADQAQRDAKAKLAEMNARLAELETDVASILQSARDQARAEQDAIVARAKVEAERILSQAEGQVGEMEQASARRLRTVAAELAVDMAREIVAKQMLPDDRRRVFDRALKGMQKTS